MDVLTAFRCFRFVAGHDKRGEEIYLYNIRKRKTEQYKGTKRLANDEDKIKAGISKGKPGSQRRIVDLQAYYANPDNEGMSPFE